MNISRSGMGSLTLLTPGGYKINFQKSKVFIYKNQKRKIKEVEGGGGRKYGGKDSIYHSKEKKKYMNIDLTRNTQNIYRKLENIHKNTKVDLE